MTEPPVSPTTGAPQDPLPGTTGTTGTTGTSTGIDPATGTAAETTVDTDATTDTTAALGDTESPETTTGTTTGSAGSTSSGADSSSGDEQTGTDGSSSSGDTGADTGDDPGPVCCEAGCTSVLLQSNEGNVTVHHGGAALATHDSKKNLVLWDAAELTQVRAELGVVKVELVGDRLVFERAGELHVLDAADGATLGVCPADAAWGVASDAGYLWTAGPTGLQVRELDCAARWSVAGALADAKVLATADAVHVFDADLAAQAVTRLDAADGDASSQPFAGSFGKWFADVPRFWTTQGDSHRLYDIDGAQLGLGPGKPTHGWGTRLVIGQTVRDVSAPDLTIATFPGTPRFSGPALLAHDVLDNAVTLVRLDADPVTATPVAPACCVGLGAWSFAFAGGAWAVGGSEGLSVDHLGRLVSPGAVVGLAGAPVGRIAVGVASDRVHVFDVADDCGVIEHPPFSRDGTGLWMSGDGARLLSRETWTQPPSLPRQGTRFYALPDGALLADLQTGVSSDSIVDHEVADDGSLWARTWANLGLHRYLVAGFPPAMLLHNDKGDVVPKIAPDAQHVVLSDGVKAVIDDWTDDQSYVYDPQDLVAVFPGITHGFLDPGHLLVGHYQGQQFLGSEIVDLDGLVVQATTLPRIHRFTRLGTGEILAIVQPSGNAAIFDPWTGAQLWAAPPGAQVAVAGADFVVVSHHGRVELVRWR